MKCIIQGGEDLDAEQIAWIKQCGEKAVQEYRSYYPDSHIDEVRLVVREE